MEIGQRIRQRRQELGLSLRQLAALADLTASFLSQIERDLTSPSVESLRKISDALEVPIFHFLVEPDNGSPVVYHDKQIQVTLPNSNLTYQLLTTNRNRKLEAFLSEWRSDKEQIIIPLRQETEELIYVLQGQLEIQLDEELFLVGHGDCVNFKGHMLRSLAVKGDETLRLIWVLTPPVF